MVDLGCGNAYLTFAAHRFLTTVRGLPVHTVGVDVREQSRAHNTAVAAELGVSDEVDFVVGGILDAALPEPPEVVLALHACDTATDEALGRAVGWAAPLVLAAPCCHHDIAAQLRQTPAPAPYAQLTRHGILRERLADTLTDGLRASLLRAQGYRVDVMQFVESKHTPRNTLLRAVRTSRPEPAGPARQEYDELVAAWGIHPRLAELLPMRSLLVLGALLAVPFVIGTAVRPGDPGRDEVFRFADPAIVESSGLVVDGGRFVTTNDSGDTGRVFTVDDSGDTVGVTSWSDDPVDVEALAPADPGHVWVGDIGDNSASRPVRHRHPGVGRARRADRARRRRTGWSTRTAPATRRRCSPTRRTGRLYVASKEVFGGQLFAAPTRLDPAADNRLTPLGNVTGPGHRRRVLPRRPAPRAADLHQRLRLQLPRPRARR